ncbi:hypothetical protein cypCar_00032441 [Cyprinus carpio]|nr:hypothetical protein cypCar_00032441 [Cyprinus carpio]
MGCSWYPRLIPSIHNKRHASCQSFTPVHGELSVLDLKHAIQAKYKIAVQHQVLVVNGGECMVAERRVCSYSAGTDTNPIFLFNKEMILSDRAPTIPKTTFSIENEMELKVEESLMMPAVFHTVASRTQLAVVQANFCSDLMTNLCLLRFT